MSDEISDGGYEVNRMKRKRSDVLKSRKTLSINSDTPPQSSNYLPDVSSEDISPTSGYLSPTKSQKKYYSPGDV